MNDCCWKGAHPGVETPLIPDEVDVLDADLRRHLTKAKYYRKFKESVFNDWERAVA